MTSLAPHDEVDRLLSAGDLGGAAGSLEAILAQRPDNPADWLKLAGLRRAQRQPKRALDAVNRALQLAPHDFVGLVMKASLLDLVDASQADLAWARALIELPSGPLPPPLAAAVAEGTTRVQSWRAARETRLVKALANCEKAATEDELARIVRFRSNALRKTKVYHSEPTDFSFPGLIEREFHARSCFPWIEALEAATNEIRAECEALIASDRAELAPYIQYEEHEALDQWRPLNNNFDWTAIHLWQNGDRIAANADRCPQTEALLRSFPQPEISGASPNAMFSLLAPQTTIPPHVGVSNCRLVCHLPLVVPDNCWFRVGAERRKWSPGRAWVFDDTIEHEAHNGSDELRIVLIFDVWHPGLTPIERDAVRALIQSEGSAGASGL